jgi:hypothetical protein
MFPALASAQPFDHMSRLVLIISLRNVGVTDVPGDKEAPECRGMWKKLRSV